MALSSEQQIVYLANVIAIARADGHLASSEEDAIGSIQQRIGAKKAELNKAQKQAEQPEFELTPVGNWSDKIKNLEDILYVAIVDGNIDASEKQLFSEFAKKIGITPEQFSLIASDVKNAVAITSGNVTCHSCKTKVSGSVKFCPECGNALQKIAESESIPVSYDIPTTGITVEFAESTAGGFAHAVRSHQEAPTNATCVKEKKIWYMSSWPSHNILQALDLVENLKGIRNRRVYVDGKESKWDEVFGFVRCASEREAAYRPNEYCFGLDEKRLNIWGCKCSRMDWVDWADWFSYGSFKQGGMLKKQISFVFDKKRIRHELESALYKVRFCPHLRFKLVEAVLDNLPDEVMPNEKGPWAYKKDYEESPGSILVKITTKDNGYTYTDEYHSAGVAPRSINTGLELLRAAFKTCGYPESVVKGVLAYKG